MNIKSVIKKGVKLIFFFIFIPILIQIVLDIGRLSYGNDTTLIQQWFPEDTIQLKDWFKNYQYDSQNAYDSPFLIEDGWENLRINSNNLWK